MIPAEVIAQALSRHPWNSYPHSAHREHQYDSACGVCRGDVEALANVALYALAGAGMVVVSAELLGDLADPDPCWFDHHGGCQAHGFLSLEPGERCPHAVARELLAALPEETTDA